MILGQTLDINGNIVQKIKFEPLASDPLATEYLGSTSGAIYYNTTSGVNRINNGSEWVNIVKFNGTAGRTSVTYSGSPMVAVVDIDQTVLDNYLPLSGGNITGTLSATTIVDTNFVGNRALISDPSKTLIESNVTNTELSYLTNVSANIQTQLNQLAQATVSGNGAGTPNRITKFVTSASMGDSSITDTGSLVTFTTPVSSNNTITAPNFTGLASRATSALQADTLKTARSFSLSGAVTSNVVSFNGSGNVVLSGTLANGIDATKIADGSISNTEFQYLNNVSANIQTQLTNLSAYKADKTVSITAGTMLSGGGDLSTNRTISHQTVGTSGTYSNIVTNSTGHITSARALISADIPTIPATKIADGSISDTEFQYLNNVSANIQSQLSNLSATKTNTFIIISGTSGLIGGGDLTTDRNIGLPLLGTPGTFTKVSTDQYGRVSGATNITSADVPTLPATKILEDANDRFVSDIQINLWTGTTTSVSSNSASWNSAVTSAHSHNNKSTLDLINQSLNTSASPIFNSISATSITVGNIDNTEFQYLNGTSANIQTQINNIYTDSSMVVIKNPSVAQVISGASLGIRRALSTNDALTFRSDSDTANRLLIRANGSMLWGDGTSAADVTLSRTNPGELTVGGNLFADNVIQYITELSAVSASSYKPSFFNENGNSNDSYLTFRKTTGGTNIDFIKVNDTDNSYNFYADTVLSSITPNATLRAGDLEVGTISATSITVGSIDNTEFGYLNTVSANIQTQLTNLSASDTIINNRFNSYLPLSGGNLSGNLSAINISGSSLTIGNISNTEFQYLDTVSANIQTQLNELKNGTSTRFSSAINIVYGTQSITVNHNLGYLRPNVVIIDEGSDQEIIVTPVYISTSQLVLPITTSQAFTGAILEVYI